MRLVFVAIMLFISAPAMSAVQTITSSSVTTDSTGTTVTLNGTWPDSCTPTQAQTTITGFTVSILVPPPPSAGLCFSVITNYTLSVRLGVLPGGTYTVQVFTFGAPEPPSAPALISTFTFVAPAPAVTGPQGIPTLSPGSLLLLIAVTIAAGMHFARGRR